jgi:hypothetical protein
MTTLRQLIESQAQANAPFAELVATQNYPAIAAALNEAQTVANPHAGEPTTVTVPQRVTLAAILTIATDAEGAAMYSKLPGFNVDLRDAIDNYAAAIQRYAVEQTIATTTDMLTRRGYLNKLLAIAVAGDVISQATAVMVAPLLAAEDTIITTQPATIAGSSLAESAGISTVTAQQVQASLN